MDITSGPAFRLFRAQGEVLPLVIDSPHSGGEYPDDFRSRVRPELLRCAEDAFVDRLYEGVTRHGACLLAARFPRTYIDANRGLHEIDEELLDTPWPHPIRAGPKTRLGIGLVWRVLAGEPLYERRLSVAEVQRRIDGYWRPYHAALRQELDAALARFGARWHLNVHSMPGDRYRTLGLEERPLADFVLGDLDGRTADNATLAVLERSLRSSGFSVVRNDPFKGVEIIRASGDPARQCHAVQVEVKRSLYMDERAHSPHAGFRRVQQAVERMVAALTAHIRMQLRAQGR